MIGKKISRQPIPSMSEALEGLQQLTVDKIMTVVQEGGFRPYKELAETLLEENDSVTLLSAALKLLTKEPDQTPVKLTIEAPPPRRKSAPKGYRGNTATAAGSSWKRNNYKDTRSDKRTRNYKHDKRDKF